METKSASDKLEAIALEAEQDELAHLTNIKTNMETKQQDNKYTIKDCGCYVDGARGIYAIDAIVAIAESHGGRVHDCDMQGHDHGETCFESRFAGCEFAGDVEDGCDDYMNTHYSVDGAYWGRNENGDWGLWAIEEND